MRRSSPEPRRTTRQLRRAALLGAALAPAAAHAATITVNSLNDGAPAIDGKCTVREAIQNANNNAATNPDCAAGSGADTIVFPGLSGTITLTSGRLNVGESLTVQGPGASQLTISGNNTSQVFYLYQSGGGGNYTISGLTLTNGNATGAPIDGGGGIIAYGNLTLDSVVISNSMAKYGGAVNLGFTNGSTLTVTNSTITGNTAQTQGAVLFASQNGSVSISHCTISNNTTVAAVGGGMFLYNSGTTGTASIQNTLITGNQSTGTGAGASIRWAGSVNIQDSVITGNAAQNNGGGLDVAAGIGTVTIQRSTISGNSAVGDGGGISARVLTVENCTISGNTATGKGGGISGFNFESSGEPAITARLSTITGNMANAGGNIDVNGLAGGTLTLNNAIVANGTAFPTNPDINLSGTGSTVTSNYSLIKTPGSTTIAGANNMTGIDPNLGALANNGSVITAGAPGATQNPQTELPNGGSPVIDAGDPAFVGPPSTDERGVTRVNNGRVDMGAAEVQLITNADVSVTKTAAPGPYIASLPVTFNIAVGNGGPTTALSVVVTDVLPAGASFVSATPTQGSCGFSAGTVTCNLGAIANGGSANIVLRMTPTSAGTLSNTVNVSAAPQADPNPTNNSSTAAVTVLPATAIPALGEWAKILLAMTAALLGWFKLQKD